MKTENLKDKKERDGGGKMTHLGFTGSNLQLIQGRWSYGRAGG